MENKIEVKAEDKMPDKIEYKTEIRRIEMVTHDVKRFILEKPKRFKFVPGQHIKIKLEGFEKPKSFTISSTNEEPFIELIIKIYSERNGFTKRLGEMKPGQEITIEERQGKLVYKDKGLFIAAGTGITPFLAMFRQLKKDGKMSGNKLIYSNKTFDDIILDEELKDLFRSNYTRVLTQEEAEVEDEYFHYGRIDEEFLKDRINGYEWFYVCGPKEFTLAIRQILAKHGIKHEQ